MIFNEVSRAILKGWLKSLEEIDSAKNTKEISQAIEGLNCSKSTVHLLAEFSMHATNKGDVQTRAESILVMRDIGGYFAVELDEEEDTFKLIPLEETEEI